MEHSSTGYLMALLLTSVFRLLSMFGIEIGSAAWYLLTFGGGLALGVALAAAGRWWRGRR